VALAVEDYEPSHACDVRRFRFYAAMAQSQSHAHAVEELWRVRLRRTRLRRRRWTQRKSSSEARLTLRDYVAVPSSLVGQASAIASKLRSMDERGFHDLSAIIVGSRPPETQVERLAQAALKRIVSFHAIRRAPRTSIVRPEACAYRTYRSSSDDGRSES
jgi:hypothetical protein